MLTPKGAALNWRIKQWGIKWGKFEMMKGCALQITSILPEVASDESRCDLSRSLCLARTEGNRDDCIAELRTICG